jgi:outer membrane protein
MKRLSFVVAIVFVLSLSLSVYAADVKVGVLDLMKVIDLSAQGKKAKDEMNAKIKVAENAVKSKQDEILKLKADIEKQAPMLSASALADKKRAYEDKVLDFQRMVQDYEYELQMKDQELAMVILTQTKDIIEKIGKEEGYTLILERNSGGVVYFPASVDITDKVIKAVNSK